MSASPKLWMVSAKSATDPEKATTPDCKSAVTSKATSEILSTQITSSLDFSASSTESEESCEWPKGLRWESS